ncbi:MAG: PEP/pyruvate-binding domain-containing protein, partial [Synergistaceae bacterium]|nr:PEP/pyruvate-binding domain-containing protein [Synergistaceae bacterium]
MEQSLGDYDAFRAESFFREKGDLIGAGECGGKAKGIAYAVRVIQDSPLSGIVGFPDLTVVLSTEVFDSFIDGSGLSDLYDDDDWAHVERTVESTPLPDSLQTELGLILDRFERLGSPPLAVRSSSRLEDSIALAFAGKYKTCFSPNRGTREERYAALESSVRMVFSSLFNPSARAYREKHGKGHREESIAVIIQSLSGK